jgi:HEAT repeat protein
MNETIRQRIDVLIPLLKDSDPDVRTTVAHAIEHLEVAYDITDILNTLKTGDTGARISSIYALGEIGGENVITPLVYCAGRPEDDIRSAAVEMLGRLAEPATLPVLLKSLNDKSTAIQAKAIAALSNFPPTATLCDHLRPFLKANDGDLEAEAALGMAKLGDSHSIDGIISLLSSSHSSTRQAAATALSLLPI